MAMGKSFRLSGVVDRSQGYSVLIEQRGNSEGLLVYSNNSVARLSSDQLQEVRGEYEQLCDGYAVLGNVSQLEGGGRVHHLLLATQILSVGRLGQSEVYRVTQVKSFSLRGQPGDSDKVVEVVRLLAGGSAYFSWSSQGQPVDLSRRQGGRREGPEVGFLWSRLLHLPYRRAGVGSWVVGLIMGSIEIRTVYVGATQLRAALISRLSCGRAGTRYNSRGLDDLGNTAQFVETEQLLLTDTATSSFVQIRGSVPLFWEQPGLNVGSHKVKMSRGPDLTQAAFDKHFDHLCRDYSNVMILNLLGVNMVGSKEGEANLSTAYQEQQRSSKVHGGINHVLWDFHAEGGTKNLEKLWSKIKDEVERFGYFSSVQSCEQRGVIRTNCMDCLDRSNATQSWIAGRMLDTQLASLGIELKESTVGRLTDMYGQMWLSNGNSLREGFKLRSEKIMEIPQPFFFITFILFFLTLNPSLSQIYAGTGALSQGGSKLLDGARSAARTIQNNLLDKHKQEAFDLILLGTGRHTDFRDRARLLLPRELLQAPVALQQAICERWRDFTEEEPVRVAVGNYNINGGKHFRSVAFKDVSLQDWLLYDKTDLVMLNNQTRKVDFYAVGFEEMVDLDTKNIVSTSGENARLWSQELLQTLNKDPDMSYSLVTYTQLVGVCLYLFVRSEVARDVRDVLVEQVKTGMGGTTGNKGTVSISLTFKASSLVFVCSHFAAGQSQVAERNSDYQEAVKRISFSNGRTILSHDYVFWTGDFNYRINLERNDVIQLAERQRYDDLLACDQLIQEQSSGTVFQGFREGKITFAPTYKYDLFSDDYDTSEKSRAPAYTDRVLFTRRRPGGEMPAGWSEGDIVWYNRAELRQSDHRPVLAVFDVKVRSLRPGNREKTVGEVVMKAPCCDGRLLLSPLTTSSSTWQEVQDSLAASLSQVEICLYTQLRGGEVMLQLSSVLEANKLIGRQLQTSLGAWTVSVFDQNLNVEAVIEDEMRMFSDINTTMTVGKKPPPRPSAPPAASVRPTRRAPAPPVETVCDKEGSWSPVLAPLDWPQEPPTLKLASLDWPEDEPESRETSQPPAQPPPSPPCPDIEQPPSFDPPSLDQSTGPPPFSPPVLTQPPARGPPPPVPSRGPPPPVPRR